MPIPSAVMTMRVARYYAIPITASQFLDKPRDASASVARSCNCEFAALSRCITEMIQASAKVTIECEYEVVCTLADYI